MKIRSVSLLWSPPADGTFDIGTGEGVPIYKVGGGHKRDPLD
ncbi:MAG: hypothetical protein WA090_09120 [Candidatus Nanopelagicaceae bacterium]